MWDNSIENQINIKNRLFFTKYQKEWNKDKLGRQKNLKKLVSTKTKKYSRYTKLMLMKHQFQKKNYMVQISLLNISLDIMMMMLLGHYV